MEMSGQLNTPAALSSGKNTSNVSRMMGGSQNRSGLLGKRKPLVPAGTRTPDFPTLILAIIPTTPRHPLSKYILSKINILFIVLVVYLTTLSLIKSYGGEWHDA